MTKIFQTKLLMTALMTALTRIKRGWVGEGDGMGDGQLPHRFAETVDKIECSIHY